jgi:hypothetical protein
MVGAGVGVLVGRRVRVGVGGTDVAVGGTAVDVGKTWVSEGGIDVVVGGTDVSVGGMAVSVAGTEVSLGATLGVRVEVALGPGGFDGCPPLPLVAVSTTDPPAVGRGVLVSVGENPGCVSPRLGVAVGVLVAG